MTYTLRTRAKDKAGNVGEPDSIRVKYILNLPTANISIPADNSEVKCTVDIFGTVDDTDFDYSDLSYTLGYAPGEDADIVKEVFAEVSGNPIRDALLAQWDTRGLSEGAYTLFLTVKNGDVPLGVTVKRRNIIVKSSLCLPCMIEYPEDGACLRGEVCIKGTTESGQNGLKSWLLQVQLENGPKKTIADGTEPVSSDVLTCWDTTKEVDGTYTLELRVTDNQHNESVYPVVVTVDNTPPQPNITISDICSEGDYTKSDTSISVSGKTEPKSQIVSATLTACALPLVIKDVTPSITIDADGNISGTFTVGDLSEYQGIKLKVCVRDCPGNEGCGESNCLTVDDEIPQVRILTPANCAYFNRTPIPIKGIAQDSISGVAKVEIDTGDGWLEADGTTDWSFDFYPPAPNVRYTITVRVHDKVCNDYELPDTLDIKYYPGSPTANISVPADGNEVSCIVNIMGSVDDTDNDYSDFSWTLSVTPGFSETCSDQSCSGTVISSGNVPIHEDSLAQWDTTNLLEGDYTLCLAVKNRISEVYVRRTNITVVRKDFCCGDVNGDGKITLEDASLVLKAVVGLVTLNEKQKQAADVTDDGNVTALDAATILQYRVGIIKTLPLHN